MSTRSAFLSVVLPLSLVVCFVLSADAQRGCGGGHGGFGGGHFGGGHSSHGHSGGKPGAQSADAGHTSTHHLGFLHFWSRSRSASVSATSPFSSLELTRAMPLHPLPTTFIRIEPIVTANPVARTLFPAMPRFRSRPNFFFRPFPRIHSSGCYFNRFNQICFFEPGLFFSGFGFSFFDFGVDDSGVNSPDNADLAGAMSNAVPPESDASSAANQSLEPQPETNTTVTFRGQGLDRRFFLLILKNETEEIVTDYWITDGYLEYVSRDGSRSHIPIDALDFQETVVENSYRGLTFVLRNAPATQN